MELRGLQAAVAPFLYLALLIPRVGVSEIKLGSDRGRDEVRSFCAAPTKLSDYDNGSNVCIESDQIRRTPFTMSRSAAYSAVIRYNASRATRS
jgi:hypothetical protein